MSDQVSAGGELVQVSVPGSSHQWCESDIGKDTKQTLVWKIKRFSERNQKTGECLESSLYTLNDESGQPTQCKLIMYPRGRFKVVDGWLSLSLYSQTVLTDRMTVAFSLLDVKRKKRYTVTGKFELPLESVCLKFVKRIDILYAEALLPNDTLTIVCDVTIPGKEVTTSNNKCPGPGEYKQKLYEDLCIYMENACQDNSLFDCKIICQGEEFSCHMFVLAARSPVFHAMFTSDHMEARERRVNIDNMEPRVMKELLHFIYTGDVPDMSQEGSAEELLAAAEQYQLDVLKEMCEDRICNQTSTETAVDHVILGDLCRAERLKKSAIRFVAKRIKVVVKTDGWKRLFDHPRLMTEVALASNLMGGGEGGDCSDGGEEGGSSSNSETSRRVKRQRVEM